MLANGVSGTRNFRLGFTRVVSWVGRFWLGFAVLLVLWHFQGWPLRSVTQHWHQCRFGIGLIVRLVDSALLVLRRCGGWPVHSATKHRRKYRADAGDAAANKLRTLPGGRCPLSEGLRARSPCAGTRKQVGAAPATRTSHQTEYPELHLQLRSHKLHGQQSQTRRVRATTASAMMKTCAGTGLCAPSCGRTRGVAPTVVRKLVHANRHAQRISH
mmetsp:Transcript_29795/g.69259  ORF Transcript_29795/g.69259 Transcript_29795/m.69259 type:complete len:214 (-) Transcript_29795:93-734(-)